MITLPSSSEFPRHSYARHTMSSFSTWFLGLGRCSSDHKQQSLLGESASEHTELTDLPSPEVDVTVSGADDFQLQRLRVEGFLSRILCVQGVQSSGQSGLDSSSFTQTLAPLDVPFPSLCPKSAPETHWLPERQAVHCGVEMLTVASGRNNQLRRETIQEKERQSLSCEAPEGGAAARKELFSGEGGRCQRRGHAEVLRSWGLQACEPGSGMRSPGVRPK